MPTSDNPKLLSLASVYTLKQGCQGNVQRDISQIPELRKTHCITDAEGGECATAARPYGTLRLM